MTADYHLHTPLCLHATGSPIEYARVAVERGFDEIGFADHCPMWPEPYDDWRMRVGDLPRYQAMIAEARAAFPALTIRAGLECDFIAGREDWIRELARMADWDFLIGSVHYIAPGWAVDNPEYIGRFREVPVEEIWTMYFRAYEKCVRSGLFDFVAHPDLPKKFGWVPEGNLRRFYEPVIAALAETGTAFEINTAGLRKPIGAMYPAREFVELARAAGVGLVISSDAHAPEEVGADFAAAREMARAAGYRETLRFERRAARAVAL